MLASKVERLSVWNAVHLVHFSPLLDYCPIWFFSKKKKKKKSNLVHFSLFWSNSVEFGQFGQFNQFQSILVHFGPILSTLVYFCPHRSISAHSVHYDPLRSNSFHFCPFWSILVQFNPLWFIFVHFGPFGPFWSISVPIRSSITLVSLKPTRSFMEHKTVKSYNHESMRSFD